ncbi:filamentous hemagglutinin N-terminal domain-containing protein [Plectonema cf. radiosum LEGE 06105]|uniref:Filamentous hemagglutinin N-terminal domain-containing protein n=1 Tax=Plectonema cf. radiosum LEGE 06105 TaxID=945769 RepID=A0A8J7K417_9CYAN|nr:filamentous hemagglutinin N-terminal domain-containing protein [Plectonema radiosum]MBE9214572.1 filamentous hemagglutinin N-terminal domain-containing protein [Plectonema cf. radiosum LEGE 06105]
MKDVSCNRLWKFSIKILLGFLSVSVTSIESGFAQSNIVPDNTLGTEPSQINNNNNVNRNGIPSTLIEGGAERGQNLFHSLQELNVGEGRGAYFVVPNDNIQNVLTRVTGNNRSEIFGILGTISNRNFDPSNANLFLINPNGIVFGENASLDINGSFVGTTANAIQFAEQGFFSTINPQPPALLTVNPSAFLFSQINQTASIQNNSIAPAQQSPSGSDAFGLRVPDGKSLLLVGGNVNMNGGELNAYGGRVELGGLAETGTVALDINGNNFRLEFPDNVTRADVSLTNQAKVYVEGAGGGDIVVNAGNVEIREGSFLSAGIGEGLGTPETVAGDVTLNATGEITVADSSIFNNVRRDSRGNGGKINITTESVEVTNGARLNTGISGYGNAGSININARDMVLLNGIDSNGLPTSALTNVEQGAIGNAGNIKITTGSLEVINGALLESRVRGERGDAGNVTIAANDIVSFSGKSNGYFSGVYSTLETGAIGKGGNIDISAGSLSLNNGAQMEALTRGQGNAGNVFVKAIDSVSLADADIFSRVGRGGVGKGGNINIDTNKLSLTDRARLSASTFGEGKAGSVRINATDTVSLTDANIFSTVQAGGVGDGGNIEINAASLTLRDSAQLQTSIRRASDTQPAGRGNAGDVNVNVTGVVDIAGVKNGFPSAIFSRVGTGTIGNGGNITVDAGSLNLAERARLSAATFGEGDAGNVTVTAKDTVSLTDARIFSTVEAEGVGNGGNIHISAGSLSLTNGAFLSADMELAAKGDSGNIYVKTNSVSLDNGSRLSTGIQDNAMGDGGNITVETGSFSAARNSELEVSTRGEGTAGNIKINAKEFSLSSNAALIGDVGSNGKGGGNINLVVEDTISLIGGKTEIAATGETTRITLGVQQGGKGSGGNLTIKANSLVLRDGAFIKASTQGEGAAGNININTKVADISGSSPNSGLSSGLFTSTDTSFKAGDIIIDTEIFRIADGAALSTRTRSGGDGGAIKVDTNLFEGQNGAQLVTTTSGSGKAGNILLNAKDRVTISGVDQKYDARINQIQANEQRIRQLFPEDDAASFQLSLIANNLTETGAASGLFANALNNSTNEGGSIEIKTEQFTIQDRAEVTVSSNGSANAGNLHINADLIRLENQGKFTAFTAAGTGGNILLSNLGLLEMRDRSLISAEALNDANGGNITINAPNGFIVAFPKENSDISANAFRGNGGNVEINSQGIFGIEPRTHETAQSDITASSQLGVAGNVNLTAPDNSGIQNSLTELLENPIDSEALIASSCVVRSNERNGTFFITGAQGFPYRPGDAVPSVYSTVGVQSVPNNTSAKPRRRWKIGDPIVEPSGVYRLENGRRILSRECSR